MFQSKQILPAVQVFHPSWFLKSTVPFHFPWPPLLLKGHQLTGAHSQTHPQFSNTGSLCQIQVPLLTEKMHVSWIHICWISIGNSTFSKGIWDKYCKWYFKIHQIITSRGGGEWYLGSFEISQASIYPKYPQETLLFLVYTTKQRNFALYVAGVIFTCKYFKFGSSTTGLNQSHFRNVSL